MTNKETVQEALKLAGENPSIIPDTSEELISTYQSFVPFIYYLVQLMKPKKVFEWGPGTSTSVFLLADNSLEIHSYENLKEWNDLYKSKLLVRHPEYINRIHFNLRPLDSKDQKEYINPIEFFNHTLDIILIDGKKRDLCMISAQKMISDRGVILVHDMQNQTRFDKIKKHVLPKTRFLGHHKHPKHPEYTAIWIQDIE